MEFSIGRLHVKVELSVWPGSPLGMGKSANCRLAKRILAKVTREGKIERIRVLRQIAIDEGWQGWGLKTSKDWVEAVFADNGSGEIAL